MGPTWHPAGIPDSEALLSESSIATGTRGAQGPHPPSHSCLTGQEWPTSGTGLRGTGTKAPRALASGHLGAEGLACSLVPCWAACRDSGGEGQSRQASTCRHSGKALWQAWGGSYTKALSPSSGSSPGGPAPWLFHMRVSHASSLSPDSDASSAPGEEGDRRSGVARAEGHRTLPQVAVSEHLPTALQVPSSC